MPPIRRRRLEGAAASMALRRQYAAVLRLRRDAAGRQRSRLDSARTRLLRAWCNSRYGNYSDPARFRAQRRQQAQGAHWLRLQTLRRGMRRRALRRALRHLAANRGYYGASMSTRRALVVQRIAAAIYPGCTPAGVTEARFYRRLDIQRQWCGCGLCGCASCNPMVPWTMARAQLCGMCECTRCYPTPRRCNRCACTRCYPVGQRRNCNRCTCLTCYSAGFCGRSGCMRCTPRIPAEMQGHDFKPFPQFHSLRNGAEIVGNVRDGERYYGIEVECERRGEDSPTQDEAAAFLANNEGLRYYAKSDGSLNDGVEIVSHPATFAAWCARGPELRFAKWLRHNGYSSYSTTTCGFHCHVSRTALPQAALARLLLFVSNHARAVKRWSRRRGETLDRWARIEVESVGAIVRKVRGEEGQETRYVAVNCTNDSTIEFRIFRGTLISASILKNIGLVESLVSFARTTNSKRLSMSDFLLHVARESKAKDRTAAERAVLSSVLDWIGPETAATADDRMARLPVES